MPETRFFWIIPSPFLSNAKIPQAKAWGYTNKAREGGLKFLQAALAAKVCVAAPLRVRYFNEGIIGKTGFLVRPMLAFGD